MIQYSQTVLGPLSNNVYLAVDEETGDGLVVDPFMYTADMKFTLSQMGLKNLRYILLTHGHWDHILGVNDLKRDFPDAKVVISHTDVPLLTDGSLSLSDSYNIKQEPIYADIEVSNADSLDFGSTKILVMSTPGHTAGSVVYLLDEVMFSGDTLFCGSVGRTDFPTSSMADMRKSVRKLKNIPQNYNVLPGHGELSTLENEKKINPFFDEAFLNDT